LIHDGRDRRAPQRHANVMPKALKRAGNEAQWYADGRQGHGFTGTRGRVRMWSKIGTFMSKHLDLDRQDIDIQGVDIQTGGTPTGRIEAPRQTVPDPASSTAMFSRQLSMSVPSASNGAGMHRHFLQASLSVSLFSSRAGEVCLQTDSKELSG
jgi:hypothetical protein